MGRNGAAGVNQHYSVAKMADRVLDIYSEIVGRDRSHAGRLQHQ
jgi:hypothetical protein